MKSHQLSAIALILCAGAASAQSWTGAVGLGMSTAPRYVGGDEYRTRAIPYIQLEYANKKGFRLALIAGEAGRGDLVLAVLVGAHGGDVLAGAQPVGLEDRRSAECGCDVPRPLLVPTQVARHAQHDQRVL